MSEGTKESSIESLYRGVIMDHYRRPSNRRAVADATHRVRCHNALCGDDLRLELKIKDGSVADAGFDGEGCAISMAATSMLTEMLVGKSVAQVEDLIRDFTRFITGAREGLDEEALEDLAALAGVSHFPVRVKCALLPFSAIKETLSAPS